MKISFNALTDFTIKTIDREDAAKVENFLYDERNHKIRYLVARCGTWLLGERVLVPAVLIKSVDPKQKTIELNMTSSTLEACPSKNNVETVSDELVLALSSYYSDRYPKGNFSSEFASWTSPAIPISGEQSKEEIAKDISTHLISIKNLESYDVLDKVENDVGRMHDVILDFSDDKLSNNTKLAKVVVKTGSWLEPSMYLLDIKKVRETDPIDRNLVLAITKHTLKRYDEYSEDGPAGQLFR